MNMKARTAMAFVILFLAVSCQPVKNSKRMEEKKISTNDLICDPDSGVCEVPLTSDKQAIVEAKPTQNQKIKVMYFTDPICSSCWGIEPQLRKLKLEYGDAIDIEYRMGGLLPDWSYNSGGISKPSDVASHWDEVSPHYDMPIDGDVWLEDPLTSSYPPSIAFKAAQLQDRKKAIAFLRIIREMVFLEKKNITKSEHLEAAAQQAGLDIEKFKLDYKGIAPTLFKEDLNLAQAYRVRGFPTIFFFDTSGNNQIVYGAKPYNAYESELLKIKPSLKKVQYDKSLESLFSQYNSLTAREYAELSQTPRSESESALDQFVETGKLQKLSTKNGSIWRKL